MNAQCGLVDRVLNWDLGYLGSIPGSDAGLLGDLGQITLLSVPPIVQL